MSEVSMKKEFSVINPFTKTSLGIYSYDNEEKIFLEAKKVREGLETQRNISAKERGKILGRLGKLLKTHKEKIAKTISLEIGKTISDSRVEIERAMDTVFAAGVEVRSIKGEALDSDAYGRTQKKMGIVTRQPIGVVLAITPFNFPINLALHKIAPAFAMGNTILLKPGEQNYLSAKILVDLCYEAGFPEDVIRLIMPSIPDFSLLIQSDLIECISFTGGTETAKAIGQSAGIKKLLLELGGNDPLVIMNDADIELAVDTVINQRFGTSGQRCTAPKRVFVHEEVYDDFKKSLVEKTKRLKVGDPMLDETFVGTVVDETAAVLIEQRIQKAIDDGAQCLVGNKREGNIVYPTVLENVDTKSELVQEETFGPVIPLFKFSDIDWVLEKINEPGFGLQAGIFTDNIKTIKYFFEKLKVGALIVNDGPGFRVEHFPFGGIGKSGLGREGVRYAMEEMSVLKTLVL